MNLYLQPSPPFGRSPIAARGISHWASILCVFFAMSFGASAGASQELRVAAAADLQFAFPELAAQFEKQSGVKLAVTFGSSGNFFAQIQNGAPFDLFLSADSSYPQRLLENGFAEPGTLQTYAYGRIVLWLPQDSPLDPSKNGLRTLLDSSIQKIAIANPEHAPYGRAAVAALQKAGLYEQLKNKLVLGENISQAAQFAQSGSAQAGIVALSLALSPAMRTGKRWEIPADMYPPLQQGVVVVKASRNKDAARAFITFLQTDAARAILERNGFSVPAKPVTGGKP